MEITSDSAMELWKKALQGILKEGTTYSDSNKRVCKELLQLHLILTNFNDIKEPIKFLTSSKKWVYPKINEIESIILENDFGNSYVYSYGERIFSYGGKKNQIDDFIIPLLKKDSLSRRAVVSIWDPIRDNSLEGIAAPGLVSIDLKIREQKLHLTAIVRSNDIYIGWPANLYQLFILGKYICEKLNIQLGTINTFSTSAHIFKENFPDIKKVMN